jgi:hypothetical protein
VPDLCHLILDQRVTPTTVRAVEARKYPCGLAFLRLVLADETDVVATGDRKKRLTKPFEMSHLGLSGTNLLCGGEHGWCIVYGKGREDGPNQDDLQKGAYDLNKYRSSPRPNRVGRRVISYEANPRS